MKIKKNKVLIVGGTGFIGYHFAKLCLKKNFDVISISRSKPSRERKLRKIKYLYVDISKKEILKKKLKPYSSINCIVNFGGDVDHKNRVKVYKSHFIGLKNLCDFFIKKKITRFIQIGSSMEYGRKKSPHIESELNKPISNYGNAKFLATKYLINLSRKYKFPCVVLRPYQVYGPNQDNNRFIPFIINSCLKNQDFPCSEGKQFRDFLFITNFVEAVYKCLKIKKNLNGQIINIGYGKPQNLKKIINFIMKKIKKGKPEFGKINLRNEENMVTYPSIKKSKKLLNWYPKTKFKYGVLKTISYYKNLNS